jgi:trans-o-hydroxybenzylidenepyruvate hydratase-aldolase
MLQATDLRGVYAIIPTPAKAGADRWDATDTVDLEETARVLNQLIADGVNGLIILGTTGECATLTPAEFEAFVDCVLTTVAKRIPTFVGTTALGTHEVVRRTRFAQDRGADGVLVGMPMWQPLLTDSAVEYYRTISEAFPKLSLMVYANARAFRFSFPPAFWAGVVAAAPTVMAAKFSRPDLLLPAQEAAKGRVHFLPHESAVVQFSELAPATTTACWSTAASMGPEPAIAIMQAVLAKDAARMKAVQADLDWAGESVHEIIANAELFASYNIQVEKLRIEAAGYLKTGPLRPPYNLIPEKEANLARENGRRWKQIRAKYAALPAR